MQELALIGHHHPLFQVYGRIFEQGQLCIEKLVQHYPESINRRHTVFQHVITAIGKTDRIEIFKFQVEFFGRIASIPVIALEDDDEWPFGAGNNFFN